MSIPGQQSINIGLPNESANSDSLYTAFNKTQQNFTTLFTSSSPFNTFNAGDGVSVDANSSTGTVTITNTGVTNIIAGTGITIDSANGNVTISSNGGGNGGGGTVTSVGLAPVSTSRLTVTGSPIVSSGTMSVDLAASGVTAGTYANPNVTVDTYGRVTSIANGSIAGTVTSVGLTPGAGVQISGGPITSNGNITVTNTGVLRLNAGAGILLSSGNGNVTISANTSSGTVTAVGVSSNQLVITGSPIVTAGTIGINLPNSATFTGTVTAGNIRTDNLLYANGTPWDLQEAAGSNNQIQFNSSNNFAASGNLTFNPSTNVLNVVGNVNANRINANGGLINGNLIITGNISPAAAGKVGGIKPGPGVDVSLDGELTIDTANLPLSFGNFTANNNVLSIVNADEDMILETEGNAEIQLVGNVGLYRPGSIPPNVSERYLKATNDGQIQILVPTISPTSGAVNIIGSTSGNFSPPVNTGVMLQLTGQANTPSRLYNDGIGNFAAFVGRRINGSVSSPTAVQSGDELIRISSTGYNGTEVSPNGSARIVFQAMENFTTSNTGSNLSFWTTAIGSNTLTKIATIDNANGLSATQVNSTGNVTAGNLVIPTGNIIYTPRYGAFYSNVDQTNPVANTAMAMTFNNTSSANGVAVISSSQLTIRKTGVYNIQFSAQVAKTGGGTSNVDIWLSKNGTPVDWTNTVIPITSGAPQVASWNFVENVTVANTYYQIMWSSADTLVFLDAQAANTSPTRPGVPSVIVTVTPVGA